MYVCTIYHLLESRNFFQEIMLYGNQNEIPDTLLLFLHTDKGGF